jgi:hypothetical protein
MNGNDSESKMVQGHQRAAHIDGHGVNESYKVPSATGRSNPSYMHPHVQPLSLTKPWQTVDKQLGETSRPSNQLSIGKTVFPVSTEKVRGAPRQSKGVKSTAGPVPGPAKPTVF